MKIINLSAMMTAARLFATTALAANMLANGVIRSVDSQHDSIALVESFEAETSKVGEKVNIVFETENGKMIESSVKAIH